MMTQALNTLNISSSPGEESLAKKASARKQAGRQNNGIGHVGLRATNPAASAEFYRDVLGMEIVGGSTPDHPLGATAFLSSRPDEESHEIALFADPAFAHVAFKVSSLAELRSFHARVVEKNIPIKVVFNHRVSFAFYFDDPDGPNDVRPPRCRQQFTCRVRFQHVATCSRTEGFLYYVKRAVFADKEDFGCRRNLTNSASGFNPIQCRKSDVEQDQVWLEFFDFLNSFQPVGGFGNYL